MGQGFRFSGEEFLFQHSDIYAGRLTGEFAAPAPLSLKPRVTANLKLFPVHPNEQADLQRIRDYKIESGGKTWRIYRGDTHRHTEFSMDGNNEGTLFQTYRYALDAVDLDFLAVSEHNGAGGPDVEYINWLLQQVCDVFMLPRRVMAGRSLLLAANSLYADGRAVKVEDRMSKRAVATKSAISSARAATTTVGKRSRPPKAANPAAAPPPATVDFWQGYEEWQPIKANPAKRRAYIKKICRRIAEEFKPEKIILFGSQAYGEPRPDSDVDLLVLMQFEGSYFQKAHEIRMRLGLTLPIDLLVRTPEELQYRLEIGDSFMREIVERGKVMYEANHN